MRPSHVALRPGPPSPGPPSPRPPSPGRRRTALVAAAIALGTSACTWVELTPSGRGVRSALAAEVADCQKVGQTRTTVVSRLVFVDRSHTKVALELTTLARNEAATLGANAVVASGPIERGSQSFDIYRCDDR